MSKTMIEVKDLTCDYGHGRGVFHLSFAIEQGEVFGFLGPNGAGKTTTIRQLMGFVRPDSGTVRILGMDCFADASKIQKEVGYLPGELALMEDMSGIGFLRMMAGIRNMKDTTRMEELIQLFSLDASQEIRRMSKGTKQKVGLVCALMHNPKILLLDEPTSGLDPLMQNRFAQVILKEKEKGTTVLLSSHLFEETERVCDRVAILRAGRLVATEPMQKLHRRVYQLTFSSEQQAVLARECWQDGEVSHNVWTVSLKKEQSLQKLLQTALAYGVCDLREKQETLEEMFLHFYGEEQKNG